ncbi:antitoxin [Flexivirga sp. ID2601S]|uniref:Antitoxin n=1 Tax=Flexivirga aerilata TaxID=1656889 RepID=A0A849AJG2_9MICO|nr:antitoxin [Flexivirga aerilata]
MANNDQFKKAGDAAQQAKEKAGKLAHDNRDKIRGALGKLASTIDDKTSHKYSDKINKAKDAALKGADKLADQAPGGTTPGGQVPGSQAPGGQTPPAGTPGGQVPPTPPAGETPPQTPPGQVPPTP